MRTREQIEGESMFMKAKHTLVLEVLLDIRDLLVISEKNEGKPEAFRYQGTDPDQDSAATDPSGLA